MIENNLNVTKYNHKAVIWNRLFIFHELQQFLDNTDLAKISLLNRYLREKLKYKVFSSICLSNSFLSEIVGYFGNFSLNSSHILGFDSASVLNFKGLKIDPFVSELVRELCSYSPYLKCLKFSSLHEAGYFIIPSISILTQLKSLKLHYCHLGISEFYNLLEKLEKLECLELSELVLVLSLNESIGEYDKPLPSNLKELTLYTIYATATDSTKNPHDFIFNCEFRMDIIIYYLQLLYLPKLIKFNLYSTDYGINYICNFLSLNPQLLHIRLPFMNFTIDYLQVLSGHGNINSIQFDVYYAFHLPLEFNLPYLYSLNSLTININRDTDYSEICKIIRFYPNLANLNISFNTFNSEFITNILRGLNIIYLKLSIKTLPTRNFDLSIFSEIKIIDIKLCGIYLMSYNLPSSPMKTRSITLSEIYKANISYNFVKESFERNSNWKTILNDNSIKLLSINIE
jgi:hypothetical protein